MRTHLVSISVGWLLTALALSQPPAPTQRAPEEAVKSANPSTGKLPTEAPDKPAYTPEQAQLLSMFETKVTAEWEALKKKDAKAYGDFLADDYEGIEVDGQGERTKRQALDEVPNGNISDYTLFGFKFIPLCPDAAGVIYEVTIQFPPRSAVRYSRVYITELWVKRKDEWKVLHYQETHVR